MLESLCGSQRSQPDPPPSHSCHSHAYSPRTDDSVRLCRNHSHTADVSHSHSSQNLSPAPLSPNPGAAAPLTTKPLCCMCICQGDACSNAHKPQCPSIAYCLPSGPRPASAITHIWHSLTLGIQRQAKLSTNQQHPSLHPPSLRSLSPTLLLPPFLWYNETLCPHHRSLSLSRHSGRVLYPRRPRAFRPTQ